MRKLLGNLPGIAGLLLTLVFSMDLPALRGVKTERTFGLWLVVLAPLAIAFLAAQLALWWRRPWSRPWRTGGTRPD